jgi:hypothetical protein
LQLIGLRQIPIEKPGMSSQTTLPAPGRPVPAAPQQSLSLVQRSPLTWQPSAGWQTLTLYGPYGAHRRLQHESHPVQSDPSFPPLQYVDPLGGAPHVPMVWPWATVHTPPQQSGPDVHASPS